MIPDKVIVVAKYKENTDWCVGRNCVIIEKDKDLPNTGREASTYAWYIVNNYDNLPKNITFCQGDPFTTVKSIDCDYTDLLVPHGNIIHCKSDGSPSHPGLKLTEMCKELNLGSLEDFFPTVRFIMGAQFTVNSKIVLRRPKEYYIKVLDLANNFQDGPWCLERFWLYIFLHKNEIIPLL